MYEQAFETIKSSTGISDIEEIVKIFTKMEEKNFSLMTWVNNLNADIEGVESENKRLTQQAAQGQTALLSRRLLSEGDSNLYRGHVRRLQLKDR